MPQACILLATVLPRRDLKAAEAIATVRYVQHGNHKAKLSHSRRHTKRRDKP